jgi:ribonuclease BN (tRNA processing enzyme)
MPDELIVIGSSSGVPTTRRFPPAYALTAAGKLFLLDCGAPVSNLLYRYHLDPLHVQAVFISHWHMDHVAGLGLLLTQNHLLKRPSPLTVYGPRGTRGKVRRLLYDSFLSPDDLHYRLKAINIEAGKKYKEALIRVTYFNTQHLERPALKAQFGPKATACGMVIDGPGWRVIYSGDLTAPDELAPYIGKCDLLIHEMAHHKPEHVADFVGAADVPHVLISHIGPKYDRSPERIREAFAGLYNGHLTIAEDGTRVGLGTAFEEKEPP